ncbi:hypothetical protein SLS62_004799 [Diatrype stigma]|uniref:Alcohol dehydrogenase iron-type/glycerol dehydrogenase GldA domain-containing protein n=1 Tax=Diatrype stigma TaxID=117547 RepID=A0AAN9UW27_9PEZI
MTETFRPAFPGRDRPMLSYGLPFPETIVKHAEDTFHASRIYVICSASLARNTGKLDELKAKLGGKFVGVRIGMRPHSQWSEIFEVAEEVRKLQADLLVTLGGGSLTDAAKIVSYVLLPKAKLMFHGAGLRGPALVILDPALAVLTPARVWLSTGVKAVDHCVETLCAVRGGDDAADADARRGLASLIPGLLQTAAAVRARDAGGDEDEGKVREKDMDARLTSLLGVGHAMSAASRGVPLGASHGIGHQLGPMGIGHGETSCILLPAVCAVNYARGANVARQDAVAAELWKQPLAAELFEARGFRRPSDGGGGTPLSELLDAFIRGALGMPRTLKEFGIGEDQLDSIADYSLLDHWVKTNPAPLDKDGILEILRSVCG